MITTTDLFGRFQQRLVAAGGQAHAAADLTQAAEIIATHPARANGEVVVAPDFAECQPWSAILPLLTGKGLTIREAASPASVADAPVGLSSAELAVAETGSVLLAENSLEFLTFASLSSTLQKGRMISFSVRIRLCSCSPPGSILAAFTMVQPSFFLQSPPFN